MRWRCLLTSLGGNSPSVLLPRTLFSSQHGSLEPFPISSSGAAFCSVQARGTKTARFHAGEALTYTKRTWIHLVKVSSISSSECRYCETILTSRFSTIHNSRHPLWGSCEAHFSWTMGRNLQVLGNYQYKQRLPEPVKPVIFLPLCSSSGDCGLGHRARCVYIWEWSLKYGSAIA